MSVWEGNENKQINIDSCDVYVEKRSKVTLLTVNTECNFLHFSMFVFYNECQLNSTKMVLIMGDSVETSFIPNRSNCTKVRRYVSSTDNVKQGATEHPVQHYVIQFYSGSNKPDLAIISCKTKETVIHFIGDRYYLFSKKLTRTEADVVLNMLRKKCQSTGWVRPFPKK